MNVVVLDLETYFDDQFSLKKLTIPEYVHDPRFAVHGLAIAWPDGAAEFAADVPDAIQRLQAAFGEDLESTTVVGHNLMFDLYVLSHCYGMRPRNFVDTMLLAYHVHGRRGGGNGPGASLAALAERYGLEAKGNLDFMQGVRHPDARQQADLDNYARNDVQITGALAERLLPQITRPSVELPVLMHTVRLFTERGVFVNTDGIDGIEREVQQQAEQCLAACGADAAAISSDKQFAKLLEGALAKTDRSLPTKAGKNGPIPAVSKQDPAMQALCQDDDPVVANLAKARLEKKGQDQKLARVHTLRRIARATGGMLPPYIVYYGGHTGRFAGGGGFNVQNMGTSGIGGRIRNLLVPRPGHRFVIGDLAQIEARITAWFAGEEDMLRAFAEGRDIYSEFAGHIFNREVRKPTEEDPPETKQQLGPLRQVGKQAVLGLGFGMGAKRFLHQLQADRDAARLFASGDLTRGGCRQIVQAYRETYPGIPELWRRLETAARNAFRGIEDEVSGVGFARSGNDVLATLPSGRALRYPDLRLDYTPRTITYLDEDGNEAEFSPEGPSLICGRDTVIYGGKLCENIVQATARDLLVEAILALEEAGFPVLFHVHDEVIVEVSEAEADGAVERVAEILQRVPGWAEGLPVACEVGVSNCYGK